MSPSFVLKNNRFQIVWKIVSLLLEVIEKEYIFQVENPWIWKI